MKNINIVNKIVAKKLDQPLNTVAAVNSLYWKIIREKLTSCEPTTIFIKHIGSITISKFKLYREIQRLINKIRAVSRSEKYGEKAKEKTIAEAKERLKLLLHQRNILAVDENNKRIFKIYKKGFETSDANIESDMDED